MLYPAELRGLRKAGDFTAARCIAQRNLGYLMPRRNRRLIPQLRAGGFAPLRLSPIWPKYLVLRSKVDSGCTVHFKPRAELEKRARLFSRKTGGRYACSDHR